MANERQVMITIGADGSLAMSEIGKTTDSVGNSFKKMETETQTFTQKIKAHWLELSVAVYAAAEVIRKASELMVLGAKAQQAEESFRQVASSMNQDADRIVAAMKRVSNGTVDDSDIMQKAVKGMTQGLKENELVRIMEMARIAARTAGEDVGEAYEKITDAIANNMPRALVKYGLVTKEQVKVLNQAVAAGVTEIDLYTIAAANASVRQAQFGEITENTAEKLQQHKAAMNELKDTAGTLINTVIPPLAGGMAWVASTFMLASEYIWKVTEAWATLKSKVTFGETSAVFAGAAALAGESARSASAEREKLIATGGRLMGLDSTGETGPSKAGDVGAEQKKVDELMAKYKALGNAKNDAADMKALTIATGEWNKRIEELDPNVDKISKEITSLWYEASKMQQKGVDIWAGWDKGVKFLQDKKHAEDLIADWDMQQRIDDAKAKSLTEEWEMEQRIDDARAEALTQEWDMEDRINKARIEGLRTAMDLEREFLDIKRQEYDVTWQTISAQIGQVGGEMGRGLGMMARGVKGIGDIAAGIDPDTIALNKKLDFYMKAEEDYKNHKITETQLNTYYNDLITAQEQATASQRLSIAQNLAGAMAGSMYALYVASGQHSKAMFVLYKAFAVAETIISTISAAQKAYEKGMEWGGPPLAIAFAAMATAAGLARVAAIVSQQPGGGSAASSGGGSGGSSGGRSSSSQPSGSRKNKKDTATEAAPPAIVTNYNFYGTTFGDVTSAARALIPELRMAEADNVH